jgi:hypothetical protein
MNISFGYDTRARSTRGLADGALLLTFFMLTRPATSSVSVEFVGEFISGTEFVP